jgi:hypothetical protein
MHIFWFGSIVALNLALSSWKMLVRVRTRYVKGFLTFGVCPSNKHCPARCAYAANVPNKDLYIFAAGADSPIHHLPKIINIFFIILMFLCYVVLSHHVLCVFLFVFVFVRSLFLY